MVRETYAQAFTFCWAKTIFQRGIRYVHFMPLSTQTKTNTTQLQSDEIWHHHRGVDLNIYIINPTNKTLSIKKLGSSDDAELQVLVPKHSIFAAKPVVLHQQNADGDHIFSLVGCTMSFGFDFSDFRMVGKAELLNLGINSEHNDLLQQLARLQ